MYIPRSSSFMAAQFYGRPQQFESLATSDGDENDDLEYVPNLDDSSGMFTYLYTYLDYPSLNEIITIYLILVVII